MFQILRHIMLKQKIQADIAICLKNGDKETTGTLRLVLAAVISKEKEKRHKMVKEESGLEEVEIVKKSELSDEEVIEVLYSEIKKRKDAVDLYEKGGRQELADKEKGEIEIIIKYLPEQLSEEDLKKLIEESIRNTGAQTIKDMGKVMADLSPKIKGRADNAEASRIIKTLLNQ